MQANFHHLLSIRERAGVPQSCEHKVGIAGWAGPGAVSCGPGPSGAVPSAAVQPQPVPRDAAAPLHCHFVLQQVLCVDS